MKLHGRVGCLMVAVPLLRLRTRRRLTARQRLADWIVGGDYSGALDLRDLAVQTAATRPLRIVDDGRGGIAKFVDRQRGDT